MLYFQEFFFFLISFLIPFLAHSPFCVYQGRLVFGFPFYEGSLNNTRKRRNDGLSINTRTQEHTELEFYLLKHEF